MSRPLAPIPRIALTLDEAAEAAGVEPDLLKGQIYHGLLRAKRTSHPYRWHSTGLSQTGGRYLIAPEDLAEWLTARIGPTE